MGDERGGTGGADSGGCKHYRRKCDVLAPCCQRYFCCHMCHDEHFAAHYADADACSVEMKVLLISVHARIDSAAHQH